MNIKRLILTIILVSLNLFASEKISLQLLWKHQFEFAGFYMAKEKGFYKDVNLDVEFKEYKFGIDITKDVEAGISTYGINYPSLILDYANGSHIVLLNAILQSSPHVLVSLKSSGIKSIKDFKNKKIMIFDNAIKSASIKSMLNSQNVSINDMNIVKSSFNIDTLLDGTTDLKTVFLSNEVYELKQKKIKFDIWDPKDYGFDFYDDLLFTSKKEFEHNPNRVKRFQEASMKGWEYAFNNIDETIKIIKEKYNSQNKSIKALRYEAEVLKSLAYYKTDKLGKIDQNKVQRIYDIYNLMGLTSYKLNLFEMIYDSSSTFVRFTNEEKQYLDNKQYITMCVDPNWMPFEKIEKGKHIGIASDYLNLFQNNLPVPIKLIETKDWTQSIEFAKKRKCDIFSLAMETPQRKEYMDFTPPYLKIPMVLATKTGESYIGNIEELTDKKIGIIKGYASADILKLKYKKLNFVELNSIDEALELILQDKIYGLIDNLAVLTSKIEKSYPGLLQITSKLKENFELGIAARNDQKHLINIFRKIVNTTPEEQSIKILKNWLPVNILEKEKTVLLTETQKKYLQNKKSIKMCNNPSWAPIEFSTELFENKPKIEHHDMQGIAIDTLNIIEKRLNIKFEHVHTSSWKESQRYLKEGKCDILPAATITKKREEYAIFTKPYLNYELAIITKENHPIVYGIEDMLHKKMSRKKGSGLIEKLKNKYPNIKIDEVDDTKSTFLNVSNGQADYTVATLPVASYYMTKLAINNLQISGYLNNPYILSIAINKKETILKEILDISLDSISWNEQKQITDKWTKNVLKEIKDNTHIWQILGVVIVILLLLLYRQYLLGRYNKDLRQTKLKLENSLKEIQYILDTTLEAIIIIKDGICIDVNDETLKILKLTSKDQIIGKSHFDFICMESLDVAKKNFAKEKTEPYEIMAKRPDGSHFPVMIKGQTIHTSVHGTVRLTCILDLSELKQKDKLISEQAKMAAMGEMIGNIAHQWRQPLSVISMSASALKFKNEMGALNKDEINITSDSIVKSTKYLSQTIDDFRDFIKGNKTAQEFNLSKNIRRDLGLLEGMIKANEIEVILDLDEEINLINYENELTQAVINLINNAKDALNSHNLERKLLFIRTYKNSDSCILSIKDNANGIENNILNKIFEPYFTTKHQSQGTGLGLYMTHKIITESMGGDIKVLNKKYIYEDSEYKGAMFEIILPIKKG